MNLTGGSGRGRARRGDERGASLVEFALILPLFTILMLGTLTGGLAYNRKLAIIAGAREATRYGATLPRTGLTQDAWADKVRGVAVASSDGDLDPGDSGAFVCVSHIPRNTLPGVLSPAAFKREYAGTSTPVTTAGTCYVDGRPLEEARVQVIARRTAQLEAMVFTQQLRLESKAVARYEAS